MDGLSSANKPVALVTGSAKRLGKHLVQTLSKDGAAVWIHYRNSEQDALRVQAQISAAGGIAHTVQADVAVRAEVDAMFEQIRQQSGRLDILINNVGEYKCGPLLDYSIDDFESALQTNLLGSLYCTKAALSLMSSGASIINIGYSGLNAVAAHTVNTAYTISKLGLLSLTKAYAVELAPMGIRVNMVSPGQLSNSVDLPADIGSKIPAGRAGEINDVANVVRFLISENAGYVTGQNIDVAGGYMLQLKDWL